MIDMLRERRRLRVEVAVRKRNAVRTTRHVRGLGTRSALSGPEQELCRCYSGWCEPDDQRRKGAGDVVGEGEVTEAGEMGCEEDGEEGAEGCLEGGGVDDCCGCGGGEGCDGVVDYDSVA